MSEKEGKLLAMFGKAGSGMSFAAKLELPRQFEQEAKKVNERIKIFEQQEKLTGFYKNIRKKKGGRT